MNKRFSTLLAAALVAGGFSFNAMAAGTTGTTADKLKGGEFIQLTSNDVVLTSVDGALKFATAPDLSETDADLLKTIDASLWKVVVEEKGTLTGKVNTYKFQNKATGAYLTVKLQTNAKEGANGVTKDGAATKLDGTGNAVWLWDTAKGLYAASGDSIFYFGTVSSTVDGSPLSLQSAKATSIDGVTIAAVSPVNALAVLTPKTFDAAAAIELSVAQFNGFLKNGKLYFNGQDVTASEKNVLKDNSWEALPFDGDDKALTAVGTDAVDATKKFFLTNGTEVKGKNILPNVPGDYDGKTEVTKKNFLLVDYSFYDASAAAPVYNALKVDTLAYEPDFSNGLVVATESAINARSIYGKYHPSTAAFSAKYFVANDSIVLTALYKPKSIVVAETLAALGSATSTATSANAAVAALVKASSVTFAAAGGDYNGGSARAFPVGTSFTAAKFKSDGAVGEGGDNSTTGQDLIDAVKAYADGLGTSDEDKAAKKAVDAYLNAIAGLKIGSAEQTLTTNKFVVNKNFCDGVNPLITEAATSSTSGNISGQIILRQLSNTKVLTISNNAAGDIAALIQPYATKPGIGGDAEIAEGVYFIKDMNKLDKDDATKANAGYGYFFNESPVGPEYIAKEQAFNPFAQYVIKKAAGTEKGNYVIENLGGETPSITGGVTFKVSDGVYAIGTDTFSVVAATTDLKNLDKNMGYKNISKADYINNKFTITSAADVLFGQTIVMLADSSLKVAEGEMLYTLEPQPADKEEEDKYGYEDSLVRIPVTIMNADSAYIAFDSNKGYFFTNGKTETGSGIGAAKFYLIGAGTDSTYVLYNKDQSSNDYKMVISVQYKTISAVAAADAQNDLFLIKPEAAPASYKSLPKHIRVQAANGDFAAVNTDNQGVAVREGDLKSAAYSNLDFIFWLDTAKYEGAEVYKYYVTKGVKAEGETPASRMYMWNAQDSTVAAVKDKTPYMAGTATRVLFRTASIMSQDTLLVPTMNGVAKIDTVSFKENKESKDGLKHAVKAGLNSYQFSFVLADKDAEGEYNIVDGDKNYVHSQNGVLVMGDKKDALVVNILNVSADDVIATDNEQINANGVKVIATEGGVTIKGAQGKAVVINNVLGQTIAQTVLSSDNETIAAPAGVVVVNVEGEASVKAIVK